MFPNILPKAPFKKNPTQMIFQFNPLEVTVLNFRPLKSINVLKNLIILYLKETINLLWTRFHNDFDSILRYHHKVQWSEILVRFFTHSGLNLSELYCKNQAWTLLHLEIPRSRNHGFLLKYKNCVLYDFAWHILSYWSAGFQQRY